MLTFKLTERNRLLETLCCLGLAVGCPGLAIGYFGSAAMAQEIQPLPAAKPTPVPTLSVTTREVLLDVLVTDANHRPITGLKSSDFKVTEEGTPQTIRHMEEHQPMSPQDLARLKAAPTLPPNTFTNFTPMVNTNASTVILLDALDSPIESQMSLRPQMIAYLKEMQPGASIAIFQLDTELHLIQGFSSDPQLLLAAAKSKRDMPSLSRPIQGSMEEYRRVKREILRASLQSIGRYLSGFPGRKNLIWFTGEVPLTIFGGGLGNPFRDSFDVRDSNSPNDLDGLADVLTVSRVAIYPVDTRGLQVDPQFDVGRRGPPSHNAGMRFESRQAFDHMDLDQVAEATGGKAYYNTNGLKDAIAEVVSNGSNYYTIAYATTNDKWDGQFRHVKIVVDRPGVKMQHRQGYFAVNREQQEQRQLAALQRHNAQAAGKPPAENPPPASDEAQAPGDSGALVHHASKGGFAASMGLGAVPPTELIFTASLAPDDTVAKLEKSAPLPHDNYLRPEYRDKPFRNYTILIRADANTIRLTQTPDGIRHGSVEFAALVYNQEGQPINSLESTASLDLSEESYRLLLKSGLPIKQQIAVPVKGNYFLRLGVHDVGGDQVGALEIPIDQVKLGVTGEGLAAR